MAKRELPGCTGKIKYHTVPAVLGAQKAMSRMNPGKEFDAYTCPECGYFHLGTWGPNGQGRLAKPLVITE